MPRIVRILLLGVAWISCALGLIGIFIPVLPTTPLLLLSTFLFARCSPRCYSWIVSTRAYKSYVVPFKEAGGVPVRTKVRILAISYSVMAISAFLVRRPLVWGILACVAVFLAWLVGFHIKTVEPSSVSRPTDEGTSR